MRYRDLWPSRWESWRHSPEFLSSSPTPWCRMNWLIKMGWGLLLPIDWSPDAQKCQTVNLHTYTHTITFPIIFSVIYPMPTLRTYTPYPSSVLRTPLTTHTHHTTVTSWTNSSNVIRMSSEENVNSEIIREIFFYIFIFFCYLSLACDITIFHSMTNLPSK